MKQVVGPTAQLRMVESIIETTALNHGWEVQFLAPTEDSLSFRLWMPCAPGLITQAELDLQGGDKEKIIELLKSRLITALRTSGVMLDPRGSLFKLNPDSGVVA